MYASRCSLVAKRKEVKLSNEELLEPVKEIELVLCLVRNLLQVTFALVFGYCDNSVREKDWRCRKRGTQAT